MSRTNAPADARKDWPFGRPTTPCPTCGGTGLDRARVALYATSRADHGGDDGARVGAVHCRACDGRGRLLVERPAFAPGH